MLIFRMAFRHILRHFGRNLVMVCSIFLVLMVLVLVQSQKTGTHAYILTKNINEYIGNAQILPDYTKTHEKTFLYLDFLAKNKSFFPQNTTFAPRFLDWAWGNVGNAQKPMQIMGIAEKEEQKFKGIFKDISFLGEKNAFLGENFKEKGIKINDTIWIRTPQKQDFFVVKGFFCFPNPILNENAVIIPLTACQILYNAENQCSILAIKNDFYSFSSDFLAGFLDNIAGNLQVNQKSNNQNLKIQTWAESMPEIAQMLWLDKVGFGILLGILCVVLALGLWGSVMVLAQERKKEFVQLYELGISQYFLVKWIFFEWSLVIFFGILLAVLCLQPILYYLSQNPFVLIGELAQSLREIGFSAEIHFAYNVEIFVFPLCLMFFLGFALGIFLVKTIFPNFF